MSNEWDEYAENWDVDPTVEEYAKNVFSELSDNINISGLTVLDFGCGTGALTQLMSPIVKSIVAIDPSSEMIKHLDKKSLNNVSSISDYLSKELIKKLPELEKKFDFIVALSVCGFLPDYEATLSLLKSLLKGGGESIRPPMIRTGNNATHNEIYTLYYGWHVTLHVTFSHIPDQ